MLCIALYIWIVKETVKYLEEKHDLIVSMLITIMLTSVFDMYLTSEQVCPMAKV